MVIQHNIPALNAHRLLGVNNAATAKNLEKLSSGYKINRAGDDAAGLAISEKMRGQIRGLGMAEQNAENAISLIQTAEGGMQELHAISQRMREIAVQATNGTYQDDVDRDNLDLEFQQLKEEFDRITDYTNYNGIKLLNGTPYATAGAEATQSISDLASGATKVTGALSAAETLTLQYDTDGTFVAAFDSNGDVVSTKVDSNNNNNLIVTLNNGDVLTIDGDWSKASNVNAIDVVTLELVVDSNGQAEIDKVTTGTRPVTNDRTVNSVKGSYASAADIGMTLGAITFNPATNMRLTQANSGDLDFTLSWDDDGNWTGSVSGSVYDSNNSVKIAIDSTSSTFANNTLTITMLDDNGDSLGTFAIDMTSVDVSEVYGANKSVTFDVEITGTVNTAGVLPASDAALGTNFNLNADNVTLAGQAAGGHPDPNYVPGAHTPILFQVGANGTYDQQVELVIYDLHATQLGKGTDLSLVTGLDANYTAFVGWAAENQTGTTYQIADQGTDGTPQISVQDLHVQDKNAANIAIEVMTTAINEISGYRAELGAVQNRLEYTLNNLGVTKENLTSAESTIRDVDMAKEMTEFTKNNILVQASQAMLAQANALPQGVLNLLR